MFDKCSECSSPFADADGLIVSGPGGAPRSEGSGVSSSEGPFAKEAPQTGPVVIMGTLGADGNPGTLPDAPQVGWAYVVGDAGTYGGVSATEGDTVYCKSLNPTRWGIWQSDSDDSGRDLVSVSASFGCDPAPALSLTSAKASGASSVQTVDMSCLNRRYGALDSVSASFSCDVSTENYAPYGPVVEILAVTYEFDMVVLGRSNPISAPGGLLEVPPLRDISWAFLDDPDFSSAGSILVRFTSAERDGDAFSVYTAEFPLSFWEGLSPGDVMTCETSCSVNCRGPEQCDLKVVSAPASGGRTFQILAPVGPVLSLISAKADGTSSTQVVDMSCLGDTVVHKFGDELVAGAKLFAEGPYGTTAALSGTAIDLANGCVFTKTVSANTSFTITGAPSGKAATFNLILTNGGSYTVTWPASVKWSNGAAPVLTSSGVDVLTFLTPDGGTTWYGTVALSGVTA